MKRILMTIIAVMTISQSHGVTVCAHNGTYVGILKKNVDGTSGTASDANKTWKVVYNYTTITGIAACNEVDGTVNTATTNLQTTQNDVGNKCWCKMEPVWDYDETETGITSYWVFLNTYTDANTCASSCATACMNAMKSNYTYRSGVFESVW